MSYRFIQPSVNLDWLRTSRRSDGSTRVVLYASKLAGCAGMHRYVPQDQLLDEYRSAVCGGPTRKDVIDSQVSALPKEVQEKVAKVTEESYADAKAAQAAIDDIMPAISECCPEDSLVPDAIRSAVNVKHGTEQESSIRNACQLSKGCDIRTSTAFRVSEQPLCKVGTHDSSGTSSDIYVYVGGRHDGIQLNSDGSEAFIVEIKTRQRRFLGTPLYEVIQLHAYMFIYGIRRGLLVESYQGERREHVVEFDDTLWHDVHTAINDFVSKLAAVTRAN